MGGANAHPPVRTSIPRMSHGESLVLNCSKVNTCEATHLNYISVFYEVIVKFAAA